MENLEGLSQTIEQLSCLDRMVEKVATGVGDVEEGSQSDDPLRISRRNTMSDRAAGSQPASQEEQQYGGEASQNLTSCKDPSAAGSKSASSTIIM